MAYLPQGASTSVVPVVHVSPDGGASVGSGCLLAPNLVLTARHVVGEDAQCLRIDGVERIVDLLAAGSPPAGFGSEGWIGDWCVLRFEPPVDGRTVFPEVCPFDEKDDTESEFYLAGFASAEMSAPSIAAIERLTPTCIPVRTDCVRPLLIRDVPPEVVLFRTPYEGRIAGLSGAPIFRMGAGADRPRLVGLFVGDVGESYLFGLVSREWFVFHRVPREVQTLLDPPSFVLSRDHRR
jgi:hypothetical protein